MAGWRVRGLRQADLLGRWRRYLDENNVHLLPAEEINDNNRLFVAGGRKAGYHVEQFPVNVKGCRGSSLCNLGCPNQAKQGTNRVQRPAAEGWGVEAVTRAEALGIEGDGTVVVRVHAAPAGGKGAPSEWPVGEHRVRARMVVSAGGAVGSPALLLRSRLPQPLPRLGAGFTCHPALILVAEHPRPISNDVGHPKGYFVDRAVPERFVLETCMYFPFTTAKSLFAAGAVRVHAPFADPPLIAAGDAARLDELIARRHWLEGRVTVSAAHLMGGCGMGSGSVDSVTDSWGRVHGMPWLRVADASLFPDSLEINPYVTIMALADRVAEGIRADLPALNAVPA